MNAETLNILIKRAHFEPAVAHAVGEAIETEVKAMQLVTEPVFKAGMTEMRGDMARLETSLVWKITGIVVGSFTLYAGGLLVALRWMERP